MLAQQDQATPPVLRDQPLPPPLAPQPIASEDVMSLYEQKMLEIFHILSPPTFFGATSEDAMEFLTTYREKLQSLGLVEFGGTNFIAYQFHGPTRQ